MTVDVQAPAEGYLILSEVWYPGWQATVNGAAAAVEAAGGVLRAVRVPAGASTVVLRFWPTSFTWGLAAGALGSRADIGCDCLATARAAHTPAHA